jgi:ketosteroid isomerase-like protein
MSGPDSEPTESNVVRARRGFEAALRGDMDAIAPLLDPEVKWHGGDPSAAGGCHNRSEVLEFMRQALTRRGMVELVEVIDAGDRVVVILQPTSDAGEPPSPIGNLTTFRNGMVVEMVHYPNPDDAIAAARS